MKNADIDEFVEKASAVEALVKGLKEGTVDPDKMPKVAGIETEEERIEREVSMKWSTFKPDTSYEFDRYIYAHTTGNALRAAACTPRKGRGPSSKAHGRGEREVRMHASTQLCYQYN